MVGEPECWGHACMGEQIAFPFSRPRAQFSGRGQRGSPAVIRGLELLPKIIKKTKLVLLPLISGWAPDQT